MRLDNRHHALFALTLLAPLVACGGSSNGGGTGGSSSSSSSGTPTSSSSTSSSSSSTSSSTSSSSSGSGGAGGSSSSSTSSSSSSGAGGGNVEFAFKPSWSGVTKVDVLGAFGMANDWKAPLVSLQDDGTGTWRGSASLQDGAYTYLYQVTGDAEGSATTKRFVIDPKVSAFAACPMASPTYNAKVENPCSSLTVPVGAPDPTHHVTGKVVVAGAPVQGWLVIVERQEPMSHHFFADRMTTAADGAFDLQVAEGSYRIQLQVPDFMTKTDVDRDPMKRQTLRRDFSSTLDLKADATLGDAEVQFLDYDKMTPTPTATLPTTLTFTLPAGASSVHADVYGTNMGKGKNVGDPWYVSTNGKSTTASFDGTFTTKAATETMVAKGEAYWWGTTITRSAGPMKTWVGESMPLPITWN